MKFGGEELSTCRQSIRNIAANFGKETLANFVSNFASFFGNFVQQKCGVKRFGCKSVASTHVCDLVCIWAATSLSWTFYGWDVRGLRKQHSRPRLHEQQKALDSCAFSAAASLFCLFVSSAEDPTPPPKKKASP